MPTTVYTDRDAIAAYLGMTLTTAQADQADIVAEAASDFIEQALDRSWLDGGGTVTDERHKVAGCRLWLRHPPVTAVTEVSVRRAYAGATSYDLTDDTQYELLEPTVGELALSPTYDGQRLTVSYTSTEQVPAIVLQFATELAAGMLALSLADTAATTASLTGVRRYTLWGGDLSVEFANATSGTAAEGLPASTRLPVLWAQIEALFSKKLAVA